MTTSASVSTHQPGAVPCGLGSAVALGMSHACLRLASENGRPRRAQMSRSQASRSASTVGRLAERLGDRLARQVVGRRAEAAARDDEIAASERGAQRFDEGVLAVREGGQTHDVDAERGQLDGEIAAVRVAGLAHEELRPDGEDLRRRDRSRLPSGESVGRAACAAAYHPPMEHRVEFDFDIRFANGGGLVGEGFRLDIEGDDVSDAWIADAIVRDLRLLMVESVTITRRRIIEEAHKRPPTPSGTPQVGPRAAGVRYVDLSHRIEDGLVTYRGLPPPRITDHLSREASRAHYAPGTEFQIGRIEMVANTGTYVDSPFHRFGDGTDVAGLDLARLADLPAVVIRATGMTGRAVDRPLVEAALAGYRRPRGGRPRPDRLGRRPLGFGVVFRWAPVPDAGRRGGARSRRAPDSSGSTRTTSTTPPTRRVPSTRRCSAPGSRSSSTSGVSASFPSSGHASRRSRRRSVGWARSPSAPMPSSRTPETRRPSSAEPRMPWLSLMAPIARLRA